MKKIKKWLTKESSDLNSKWWHRFLKVLFIASTILFFLLATGSLIDSYSEVVNRWQFVDTVYGKLNRDNYSNGVFSIKQLYSEEQIIAEKNLNSSPNLKDKKYLFPSHAIFLESTESFCSNKLYKQIQEISSNRNIKLFSTLRPTLQTLSLDEKWFISYLKENNIKCVMVDSYSIGDDSSDSNAVFLRPVDVFGYIIYKYDNNLSDFILGFFLIFIGVLLYIVAVLLIYNKVILYVIYGNKKNEELK